MSGSAEFRKAHLKFNLNINITIRSSTGFLNCPPYINNYIGLYIPQDIAFAGFNNDPVSTIVEPNLTTVNYPAYEIGEVNERLTAASAHSPASYWPTE